MRLSNPPDIPDEARSDGLDHPLGWAEEWPEEGYLLDDDGPYRWLGNEIYIGGGMYLRWIDRRYYRLPGIGTLAVCSPCHEEKKRGERTDVEPPVAWREDGRMKRAYCVCNEHARADDERPMWRD